MARKPRYPLYYPQLWPTWVMVGLLWLNARLNSYPGSLRLGKLIGSIARKLMRQRRHIAEVNLSLCFPELDTAAQQRLVIEHFESLGISLLLLGFSWWAEEKKLVALLHPEGLTNISKALERNRGAILLGIHFTDLDIIGRMVSSQQKVAVVYRPHDNPVIEYCFRRQRERCFVSAIPKGDIRALLRTLKSNTPVWYATDQATGGKHSALVPFFGVPASTNTGTSRLAKASGAPIIPCFGFRLSGTRGFRLIVAPPLDEIPSADIVADTTKINQTIEEAVKLAPAQYLWVHRRFKKRPGIPSPY